MNIGVANGYGAGNLIFLDGPESLIALELFTGMNDSLNILHWDEQNISYGHTKMIASMFDKVATLRRFT